jgi:hypothetical protein
VTLEGKFKTIGFEKPKALAERAKISEAHDKGDATEDNNGTSESIDDTSATLVKTPEIGPTPPDLCSLDVTEKFD